MNNSRNNKQTSKRQSRNTLFFFALINFLLSARYLVASAWILLNMRGEVLSVGQKPGFDGLEATHYSAIALLVLSLVLVFGTIAMCVRSSYGVYMAIFSLTIFSSLHLFESFQHFSHGTLHVGRPGLYIWGPTLLLYAALHWRFLLKKGM